MMLPKLAAEADPAELRRKTLQHLGNESHQRIVSLQWIVNNHQDGNG